MSAKGKSRCECPRSLIIKIIFLLTDNTCLFYILLTPLLMTNITKISLNLLLNKYWSVLCYPKFHNSQESLRHDTRWTPEHHRFYKRRLPSMERRHRTRRVAVIFNSSPRSYQQWEIRENDSVFERWNLQV